MRGQYLSVKPVARQVLDRESPSEKTEDRRAPPADTPAEPVSAAPSRPPLVWVSRPGEDGTDPMIRAAKAAFFASSAAEQASPPPSRTGGRPRKTGESDDDEPITRGYVAQILGVDVSTVRRLEARGQLHPTIGRGGIRYFEMHEVRRLKAHRLRLLRNQHVEMKLAAFVLFRKGIDWRDVAIKLRYDPYRVRRLWQLFRSEQED
jgi:hypothetical protein